MIRYLTLANLLSLYSRVIETSGGLAGIRDLSAVESALAQPQMTFGGDELYPSLSLKAASLGYSLIQNHPFTDGNKRIGHAAIEAFLLINGHEIICSIPEQEEVILSVASSKMMRAEFENWLAVNIRPIGLS